MSQKNHHCQKQALDLPRLANSLLAFFKSLSSFLRCAAFKGPECAPHLHLWQLEIVSVWRTVSVTSPAELI